MNGIPEMIMILRDEIDGGEGQIVLLWSRRLNVGGDGC